MYHKHYGHDSGGHRCNSGRGGHLYNKYCTKLSKIEGSISGLNGHVYGCEDASQVDQYTNMTKEIVPYVATTFNHGNDVRSSIEGLCIPTINLPDDLPTDASKEKLGNESG